MNAGRTEFKPASRSSAVSRRAVLLSSGAAVLVGGGAGVAVGALRHVSAKPAPLAPTELVAALAAEDDLLARAAAVLDTTAGATSAARAAVTAVRADHLAHRTALQAALAGYRQPTPRSGLVSGSPVPGSSSPTGPATPVTSTAGLSAVEKRASAAAAARAAQLIGRDATLLASIAACEATHATWLAALAQ